MKYRIAIISNDPVTKYQDEKLYVVDTDLMVDGQNCLGLTYEWDVENAAVFTNKRVFNRIAKKYNRNIFCEWDGENENTWWKTTVVMEEVE